MKRNLPSILLLLVALLASPWIVSRLRRPGSMTVLESQTMDMRVTPPPGAAPVALETLKPDFFAPSLSVTGTVEAWNSEEVVARVTGRVLRVLVYPGDRVKAGQPLLELDSQELTQRAVAAQAAVEEARFRMQAAHTHHHRGELELTGLHQQIRAAQLAVEQARAEQQAAQSEEKYRQQEWQRSQQLYQAGGISQEEWQKAQSELAESRARQKVRALEVQRAQAMVLKTSQDLRMQRAEAEVFQDEARALQASVDRNRAEAGVAETIRGYTLLSALQEGTVVERLVSPGTLVEPGKLLLRLRSTQRLRLLARVPQDYAEEVRSGAQVLVQGPDRVFKTRVVSDFGEQQPNTRTFTVEARLDNPNNSTGLRVGAYVPMQIALSGRKRRLTVAAPALQSGLDGQDFVWVAIPSRVAPARRSYYTCVMHPEVQSSRPGNCPRCQMPLQLADAPGALRAQKRPVKAGGSQAGRVAILEGLSPGDRVIVAGFENLQPGSRVLEVPWSQEGPVRLPPPPRDVKFDHQGMPMQDDYCSPTPGVSP